MNTSSIGAGEMQDQYNNFAREVDRALKDMEERLYRNMNEKVEAVRSLNQRRHSLQSQQSLAKERQKVIESTSSLLGGASLGGQPNMKKLEGALNEWLERVEEQVN